MDVKPLRELYQMIQAQSTSNSLTKKYLTSEIVQKYADVKTTMGGTLALCVNTNAYNPGALLCRTADMDCYEKFKDFFEPLIRDYHKVTGPTIVHPKSEFGTEGSLPFTSVDPSQKYVKSVRVRVGRTVRGFPFAPVITKEDRIKLEQKIAGALKQLTGELSGDYFSLSTMQESTRKDLVAKHLLFRDDDSVLRDAGGYRDWPTGRGIFINKAMTFIVWVNEEDHMRIISMDKGGDLVRVYSRLISGLKQLERLLDFVRHDRYGYITFCPSNLGTTMRASVHAQIKQVSLLPNFKDICEQYGIQPRGTDGEHTAVRDGVYDLSNKRRLGITELQAAKEMAEGVAAIVSMERSMDEIKGASAVPPVEPLMFLAQMMWNDPKCNTVAKRHLTKERVEKYQHMRTKNGVTLAHCLRHCAYHRQDNCPRNGDAECLIMFKDYMDDVIREYHKLPPGDIHHGPPNYGDLNNLPFGNLDPTGKFIISTRVRVGRSVEGFCFPVALTKDKRYQLEKLIANALVSLRGEHQGTYYPLEGMTEATKRQLIDDHFLFKDDDPVLRDAGGYRDWPSGRGIFHNANKTFLVWVVEEDHLRIISMEQGGNLANVYRRLIPGIQALNEKLKFMRNDKFGNLTCCPSNLGTSMRASVLVRIPKLSANKERLEEVCNRLNLQARGMHGEYSDSPDGIHDISNKRRLGLTELDAATAMARGVEEMIRIEQTM